MNNLAVVATMTLLAMASPPKVGGASEPDKEEPTSHNQKRWASAEIRKEKRHLVEIIANKILAQEKRYKEVGKKTGVPWYAIAGLHNMESSLSFRHHLHEGSSLAGRTKYVPKGRPVTGNPPFTWEESAEDALRHDSMTTVEWDNLENSLHRVEAFNGTGYLRYHKDVNSPYVWSYTTEYKRGKYVSDGKWSSTAVSKQCGVAAIWKVLMEKRKCEFPVDYKRY